MSDDVAGLRDFKIPVQKIAPLTEFRTRRGESLAYRLYPAWSDNLLFLIHGLAGDSRYLSALAHAVASEGLASVVTPDLRGHGALPHDPRAPAIRPGQLEEDMEELLVHVRMKTPAQRLVWGGHSLGAGLALRLTLAGSSPWQGGLLMMAPYLPPAAPGDLEDFGGWISRDGDAWRVNMPELFRSGSEVLEYDRSFLEAATPPRDFAERLAARGMKTRVILGTRDRICDPVRAATRLRDVPGVDVTEVATSHFGVVGTAAGLAAARAAVTALFV